jgi:hypothetical protein
MDSLTTYTPLGTTSNYSATANLHNLQIVTAPTKNFPPCCFFTSRSLETASNSGDSSAFLPLPIGHRLASKLMSDITTDGQSASLSWNKEHILGLRPDLYYCQTVAGLLRWGTFSDERTGLSFTTAAGPRQRSHFRVRIVFCCLRFETSLFVASNDSQCYGGGIRSHLHTGLSHSESESYATTDDQSASLSWNKAPVWGLRPDFHYCQTVAGLLMWGALSDERMDLSLQSLLALASAVILGSESRGTSFFVASYL